MSNTRNQVAVWTNNPTRKEALASGVVYPGMAVERTSATADTVKAATASETALYPLLIAVENELEGEEVDVAYASGDRVFMFAPYPGDEVLVRIVAGQSIAKGDYLTPNGDGNFKKQSSTMAKVLQACEALDVSESGAVADLVLAEVC